MRASLFGNGESEISEELEHRRVVRCGERQDVNARGHVVQRPNARPHWRGAGGLQNVN